MPFLRPQLTQALLKALKSRSVNIFGPEGQGQERLLEDLCILARRQRWLVFNLNMKSWAADYDGMMTTLDWQLREQREVLEATVRDFAQFLTALDQYAQNAQVLIVIQQFDALLDNTLRLDAKHEDLFRHLNSFRNQAKRSVLAGTVKPYNQYRLYVNTIRNTSPLDLQTWEIGPLRYYEIDIELRRCLASTVDAALLKQLTQEIYVHPQAFAFMEYCLSQNDINPITDQNCTLRIKQWRKYFRRSRKKSLRRKLDQLLNGLGILGREIDNWSLRLKVLVSSLLGLLATLTLFLDKIRQFLDSNK